MRRVRALWGRLGVLAAAALAACAPQRSEPVPDPLVLRTSHRPGCPPPPSAKSSPDAWEEQSYVRRINHHSWLVEVPLNAACVTENFSDPALRWSSDRHDPVAMYAYILVHSGGKNFSCQDADYIKRRLEEIYSYGSPFTAPPGIRKIPLGLLAQTRVLPRTSTLRRVPEAYVLLGQVQQFCEDKPNFTIFDDQDHGFDEVVNMQPFGEGY